MVDRQAYRRNVPADLIEQEFYGEIQYFFTHEYQSQWSMLALVQWIRNPERSSYGPLFFRQFAGLEVIRADSIKRCVRFLKMSNNAYYIIDKEDQVTP